MDDRWTHSSYSGRCSWCGTVGTGSFDKTNTRVYSKLACRMILQNIKFRASRGKQKNWDLALLTLEEKEEKKDT